MSQIVAMYCDGGVIGRNPSPIGGTCAACLVNATGERIACKSRVITPQDVRLPQVTNNISELWAMLLGLRMLPDGWSGTVYCDSWVTICRVFRMGKMENVPAFMVRETEKQLARLGKMTYVLLDGHPTKEQLAVGKGKRGHPVSIHNVWCDEACQRLGLEYRANLL